MSEPVEMAELTEAEREEITRLFSYVPDDEPLEYMLSAVSRIKAAARREALDQYDRAVAMAREANAAAIEHWNRADKAEAKIARVEALAEEWSIPAVVDGFDATADFADAIHNDGPWRFARDFRAALAEPTPDDAPCSCGSRDATSLTPGERLHHSPDGCTIERGGEGRR